METTKQLKLLKAIGCFPQTDSNDQFLDTAPKDVIEHGEVELIHI